MLALRVGSNGKTKNYRPEAVSLQPDPLRRSKWLPSRSLWWRRANAAAAANSLGSLAIEQLQRGFVHPRIAGGDDAAAALRGLAFPGRNDSAGAGDDRDQGGDIVGFELGLDHEIEMAGGEHAVGIAVAAIAGQPHRRFDTAECCAIGGVHQERTGRVGGRL